MLKTPLILIIILLAFVSCGVLLDTARVEGKWTLSEVEFYVYNYQLDTTKTYTGKNDATPDSAHPIIGNFFGGGLATYKINFAKGNNFSAEADDGDASTDDTIVSDTLATWSINSFDNSISIEVIGDNVSDNFWKYGFSFSNYWPLVDYSTLELYIEADDTNNKNEFLIPLENETLHVNAMKGIFTKD